MGGLCTNCSDPSRSSTSGISNKKPSTSFLEQSKLSKQAKTEPISARSTIGKSETIASLETEDYFQRNSVFMKLKIQNLLSNIRSLKQLLDFSIHGKIATEDYYDQLGKIKSKVLKLNPHQESYKDMTQIQEIDQINQIPEQIINDQDRESDFQLLDDKFKRIQESWEADIIEYEGKLENDRLSALFGNIFKDIEFKYQDLESISEAELKQIEIIRYLLTVQSDSLLENFIRGVNLYKKERFIFDTKYQLEVVSIISELSMKTLKVWMYAKFLDEFIEEKQILYEEVSQQIDMFLIAQPQKTSEAEELVKTISESLEHGRNYVEKLQQDLKKTSEELSKNINNQEIDLIKTKKLINQLSNSLQQSETSTLNLIKKLFIDVLANIYRIRVLLSRSDLIQAIDTLLDVNSQITTQYAQELNGDSQLGVNIEQELLSIRDQFEQIEEEKGFLDESDEDKFYNDIVKTINERLVVLEYDRDLMIRTVQFESRLQDIKLLAKESLELLQKYLKVAYDYSNLRQQYEDLMNYLRSADMKSLQTDNENILEIWTLMKEQFSIINNNFGDEMIQNLYHKLISVFSLKEEPLLDLNVIQSLQIIRDYDDNQLPQLEQSQKMLGQKIQENLPQFFNSKNIPKEHFKPIIITKIKEDQFDRQFLRLLQDEQEKLAQSSKKHQFKYPIYFRQNQTNTQQNFAIYETFSKFGNQDQIADLFKIKILENNELVIKMRCGAYLNADRIGLYYQELLQKTGVEIIINQ